MENDISILEFSDDLFYSFDWNVSEHWNKKCAYTVIQEDTEYDCYPNDILVNGYPVFIANEKGQGFTAYYLAGKPTDDRKDDELLFGLTDPLSVFTAKKSDLTAVHTIAGNFQLDETALSAFKEVGLLTDTGSFSVGQQWRPWQKDAN